MRGNPPNFADMQAPSSRLIRAAAHCRRPAPAWRSWLLAAFGAAWLVLVMQVGALAAEQNHRPIPAAASGLSAGLAGLTQQDPVAALAMDLVEHLPGGANGAAPPLPLHAPDTGALPFDELQGAELPLIHPPKTGGLSLTARRHPPRCEACLSADLLRTERPPAPADAQP